MFNPYGPLCTEVYELTKPIGAALNGDIDYYEERLGATSGLILEVGVGSGRLLIPLLEAGYHLHGIDQSLDMLTRCRQHCQSRGLDTELFHDRIEKCQLPYRYDAIIIPTSTFCLFPTEEVALEVLKNCFRHLVPGGRLILDLDLPFYPELGELTTTVHPLSETSGITLESKMVEIDWLHQHTVSHLKYEKWTNGALIATELQELRLRWYGLTEFQLLLQGTGFEKISLSADYEFKERPTSSNQTITFECHKGKED